MCLADSDKTFISPHLVHSPRHQRPVHSHSHHHLVHSTLNTVNLWQNLRRMYVCSFLVFVYSIHYFQDYSDCEVDN